MSGRRWAYVRTFLAIGSWGFLPAALTRSMRAAVYPADFTIIKIADTNTPVPGQSGNFTGFGVPTNGGFVGQFAGGSGVYQNVGDVRFSKLADTTTPIPGGTGNFTAFDPPDRITYFRGSGAAGQQGIYRFDFTASAAVRVADRNTLVPAGSGTFASFGSQPVGGFFSAADAADQPGIYSATRAYADTNTVAPGHGGQRFTEFAEAVGRYDTPSGTIGPIFVGGGTGFNGLYAVTASGIAPLVETNTPVSGFPLTVGFVNNFAADGPNLFDDGSAFIATSLANKRVLYRDAYDAQKVKAIASPGDAIPGRAGATFRDFTSVGYTNGSIEGGRMISFRATGSDGESGIYASFPVVGLDRVVTYRVIDTTMTLDGKDITSLQMSDASTYSYDMSFRATFADGSSGIYVSTSPYPEPAVLALPAVIVGVRLLSRRRNL